jgi:hypothetical protein
MEDKTYPNVDSTGEIMSGRVREEVKERYKVTAV